MNNCHNRPHRPGGEVDQDRAHVQVGADLEGGPHHPPPPLLDGLGKDLRHLTQGSLLDVVTVFLDPLELDHLDEVAVYLDLLEPDLLDVLAVGLDQLEVL